MKDIKLKTGSMAKWIVVKCVSGYGTDLISKMKVNEDGTYPVEFKVCGVELDFERFTERLDKELNEFIDDRAKEILCEKYNNLVREIDEIQDALEHHEKLFGE